MSPGSKVGTFNFKNSCKVSHYHCPFCEICVRQKSNFQCHLALHQSKPTVTNNVGPDKDVDVQETARVSEGMVNQ